ncbi:MAG: NAD-dependent epimerase/dehydratase family protein [Candidatus Krumholzibacteriia bacterium]
MTTSRRQFLQISGTACGLAAAGAAGALGAGLLVPARARAQGLALQWSKPQVEPAGKKLRILFLGGTRFIGPHQVEYALARGHEVTLFNRGKSNPHLFPDVEKLQGDRSEGDYEALKGRTWDAVIDNSAHIVRWMRDTGELLKDSVGQFEFISSTGVYHPYLDQGIDENGPLATVEDPASEDIDRDFAGLKVLCEQEAERWFPGRTTVIRPHLIVGPGDVSDRFTYWPARIARGGEVMAPGNPDDPVQIIDVRDLAAFCVHVLEQGHTGAFNAGGPLAPLTIGGMLHGIRATVSNDISFTWVPADFLSRHEVRPWSQMTVWIPPEGDYLGMCTIDSSKAVRHGLTYRPLADTSRDTLAWWSLQSDEKRMKPRMGCPPELEEKVLAAWHAHGAADQG